MSSYDVIGRTETAQETGLVMSSYDVIGRTETDRKTGLVLLVMSSYDVIGRILRLLGRLGWCCRIHHFRNEKETKPS